MNYVRDIFIKIGEKLGGIKLFELHHSKITKVKLLVNLKPDSNEQDQIKVKTNRSIYTIKYMVYTGKIRYVNYLKKGISKASAYKDFEDVRKETHVEIHTTKEKMRK